MTSQSNVPDFISIKDACKKYKVSDTTINNKIKAFTAIKGRKIDRIRSGTYYLINERELQEALRLKRSFPPDFFQSKKSKLSENRVKK